MPSDKLIEIWKRNKRYDKLRENNIPFTEEIKPIEEIKQPEPQKVEVAQPEIKETTPAAITEVKTIEEPEEKIIYRNVYGLSPEKREGLDNLLHEFNVRITKLVSPVTQKQLMDKLELAKQRKTMMCPKCKVSFKPENPKSDWLMDKWGTKIIQVEAFCTKCGTKAVAYGGKL